MLLSYIMPLTLILALCLRCMVVSVPREEFTGMAGSCLERGSSDERSCGHSETVEFIANQKHLRRLSAPNNTNSCIHDATHPHVPSKPQTTSPPPQSWAGALTGAPSPPGASHPPPATVLAAHRNCPAPCPAPRPVGRFALAVHAPLPSAAAGR